VAIRRLLFFLVRNLLVFIAAVADLDVPWTVIGTEQAIGRMEMRRRPVQGCKSWEGTEAGLMLSGSGTFLRQKLGGAQCGLRQFSKFSHQL